MTAIFVVMNRNGLAIAADSASSAQMPDEQGQARTVFTEQVSKIYKQERLNFVVASAGSSAINGVPIEGILNRWLDGREKLPFLVDYVESFIKWLAEESCLEDVMTNVPILLEQMERQFRSIKDLIEQDSSKDVAETISNNYAFWETTDFPNIYGFSEKKITPAFPTDLAPEMFSSFASKFLDYRLREDLYESFLQELDITFEEAFENVFGGTEIIGEDAKELLRQKCVKFNIDFNDASEPKAQLMFAGYGERDWIPYVITLSLFDFDTLLPRVSVRRVATSDSKWYLPLAASGAVNKFWNPVDANFESELRAKLSERFKGRNYLKGILEVFDQLTSEHADDVVNPIRKKINLLSVDKLGFIARQMVAMESFNSFVFQYLPEVGGHIEVVTVTRDEFKELTEIE
jgi:hypothetical protein